MTRAARGARAQRLGVAAEQAACAALQGDGWTVLARRLTTPAGEVDIVARKAALIAVIEVKARARLADAAHALSPRQCRRLLDAAAWLLGTNPDWQGCDLRFDVLLLDQAGRVRRIADAFRAEALDA